MASGTVEKWEIQDLRSQGYKAHYNRIDATVVREDLEACPNCKSKLAYEGWKKNGSYRAFAVCPNPNCDYADEF